MPKLKEDVNNNKACPFGLEKGLVKPPSHLRKGAISISLPLAKGHFYIPLVQKQGGINAKPLFSVYGR